MTLRPCPTVGCGQLTAGGPCPACARERDQRRGTRQQRGYDRHYERARRRGLRGATDCVTCGQPFTADNPATGGHVKPIREGGTTADGIAPECRRCNYGWRKTMIVTHSDGRGGG